MGIKREGGGIQEMVTHFPGWLCPGVGTHPSDTWDTDSTRNTEMLSCIHICLLTDSIYHFKMDNWSVRK